MLISNFGTLAARAVEDIINFHYMCQTGTYFIDCNLLNGNIDHIGISAQNQEKCHEADCMACKNLSFPTSFIMICFTSR